MSVTDTWVVPSPISVSNRTYIKQLQKWGCLIGRQNGETVRVTGPDGKTFRMMAPTQHKGNTAEMVQVMLDILDMTWPEFMNDKVNDPAVQAKAVSKARLYQEARKYLYSHGEQGSIPDEMKPIIWDLLHPEALAEDRRWEKARRKLERAQSDEARLQSASLAPQVSTPTEDTPTTPTEAPMEAVTPLHRTYGGEQSIRNRILNYLLDKAKPTDTHTIAEALNLTVAQANQGCAGLVNVGAARRVKTGVYMASDARMRQDIRLEEAEARARQVIEAAQHVQADIDAAVGPSTPVVVPSNVSLSDETVNEVLDLLLPGGFKAKHLPAIDAWRQATIRLLTEVQS